MVKYDSGLHRKDTTCATFSGFPTGASPGRPMFYDTVGRHCQRLFLIVDGVYTLFASATSSSSVPSTPSISGRTMHISIYYPKKKLEILLTQVRRDQAGCICVSSNAITLQLSSYKINNEMKSGICEIRVVSPAV